MSVLDGFVVVELPLRGKYARILREFLATGNECIAKQYQTNAEANVARTGCIQAAKRHGMKVAAIRRGNMLYLVNEERVTLNE